MIRIEAPAKLNLYLKVLGLREDGYHQLETLFERIDLCDELSFSPNYQEVILECDNSSLSCGNDNLVCQAAHLLRKKTGSKKGAVIRLSKRIPVSAGLGGGSSDCAAALVGLNELWGLGISKDELLELGSQLGSDVPFFLIDSDFAIGRSRGEACEKLLFKVQALWHVLVVPKEGLATKIIYEDFDRLKEKSANNQDLTESGQSLSICLRALRNGSLSELAKAMKNDLEPLAIRRCPIIGDISAFLRESGCMKSMLTGSGCAVFGLCKDEAQANQISIKLYNNSLFRDLFVLVVKTKPAKP